MLRVEDTAAMSRAVLSAIDSATGLQPMKKKRTVQSSILHFTQKQSGSASSNKRSMSDTDANSSLPKRPHLSEPNRLDLSFKENVESVSSDFYWICNLMNEEAQGKFVD